jgi:hypothetical protein
LIFATYLGSALNLRTEVPRDFRLVLKRAGLPDIRLYESRHSAATLMPAAGVHPKVVQERLDHASITLTLDPFSHVQPDMRQRAAEGIDELLAPTLRRSAESEYTKRAFSRRSGAEGSEVEQFRLTRPAFHSLESRHL